MKNDVIIDGNFQLVSLEGQPLTSGPEDPSPFTVGKALATILSGSKDRGPFNPVMTWNLCRRLFQGESVSLNADYFDALQIIVEASEQYVVILQGQILEYLAGQKDVALADAPLTLAKKPELKGIVTRKKRGAKLKAVKAKSTEDEVLDDNALDASFDEVI